MKLTSIPNEQKIIKIINLREREKIQSICDGRKRHCEKWKKKKKFNFIR